MAPPAALPCRAFAFNFPKAVPVNYVSAASLQFYGPGEMCRVAPAWPLAFGVYPSLNLGISGLAWGGDENLGSLLCPFHFTSEVK